MTTTADFPLDCTWSVNATIARYPETIAVFNAHGIDTCCGGAASVEDAARDASVEGTRLCGALRDAIHAAAA